MIKILCALLFSFQLLCACKLCTIYSPKTKVTVDVHSSSAKVEKINVNWELSPSFTDTLKSVYDYNLDNKLDETEISEVKKILLEYIEPKNFLVHISFGKEIDEENSNEISIDKNSIKVYLQNEILYVDYTLNNSYILDENLLYVRILDNENYFLLHFDKNSINIDENIFNIELLDENTFILKTTNSPNSNSIEKNSVIVQENQDSVEEESLLDEFTKKLKKTLLQIQNGDTIALITLLMVSFLYGVIHALGPGHGKALAFSYFLTRKSSVFKALMITQATAFIHIVGALILVVISVFIIESMLNSFVSDSISLVTKLAALFIIVLGAYILFKKIKNNSCSCHSCCTSSMSENEDKRQDLFFVITAGIVPCPGTVVLFLYAFVLKTYFAVFLAALSISLGMGLIIFLSSYLGLKLSSFSNKYHGFKNSLEYASSIFIIILGVLLFFSGSIPI